MQFRCLGLFSLRGASHVHRFRGVVARIKSNVSWRRGHAKPSSLVYLMHQGPIRLSCTERKKTVDPESKTFRTGSFGCLAIVVREPAWVFCYLTVHGGGIVQQALKLD